MNIEDAKAVIAIPVVTHFMSRPFKVITGEWDVPNVAGHSKDGRMIYIDRDIVPWHFLGQDIDIDRFLVLRELVTKGVADAIAGSSDDGDDAEQQRLLMLLSMTAPDDAPKDHARAVARCAESFAVGVQYGESGIASYYRFVPTLVKRPTDDPVRERGLRNIAPDLDSY